MKYIFYVFEYLRNKNKFFKLAPSALLAAVLLIFIAPIPSVNEFLAGFFDRDFYAYGNFPEIFFGITNFKLHTALLLPVTMVVLTVTISYISAIVERDMHIGDFHYVRFAKSVNNNFVPNLIFVFFSIVTAEFFFTAAAVFINLWVVAFGGFELGAFILSAATLLLTIILTALIFSMLIVWPAFMTYTGMKSFASLAHTLRLKKRNLEVAAAIALPLIVYETVYVALMFTKIAAAGAVVNALFIMFACVYVPVLVNTVYYDVSGLEREDLKKFSIWRK
ncbi:MAG: hypothetical protein LBQ40_06765 [Clostridiales bacterium]|jgi:hypothetical protein|nr:hypothetical protein [Clostridiales bacterium]